MKQQSSTTIGFHRDCGPVVVPIHRNAVNTERWGDAARAIKNKYEIFLAFDAPCAYFTM